MENLLSACLWQDGHSRVDPYLIHPHPLPQDYGYAIIAQFFFSFFFFFFFCLFVFDVIMIFLQMTCTFLWTHAFEPWDVQFNQIY